MLSLVFARVELTGKIVLDAGCGKGAWGRHIRFAEGWNQAYKVGIDLFKPYIAIAKNHRLYDDVIAGDVRYLPFKGTIFDLVLSAFVLEHLTKADGDRFLCEAKRVCRQSFILITEHGHKSSAEAGISRKALEENPLLHHRSGWTYRELHERGFTVRGFGVKYTRRFPWPCKIFLYIISSFTYMLPKFADKLIARKVRR